MSFLTSVRKYVAQTSRDIPTLVDFSLLDKDFSLTAISYRFTFECRFGSPRMVSWNHSRSSRLVRFVMTGEEPPEIPKVSERAWWDEEEWKQREQRWRPNILGPRKTSARPTSDRFWGQIPRDAIAARSWRKPSVTHFVNSSAWITKT